MADFLGFSSVSLQQLSHRCPYGVHCLFADRGSYRTGLDAYEMAAVMGPRRDEETHDARHDDAT